MADEDEFEIWVRLTLDYLRTRIGSAIRCIDVKREDDLRGATHSSKRGNIKLLLFTDYGRYLFFINRDFGLGAWIMFKKLHQIGWEKPGELMLPDVIVDKCSGAAIIPAIVNSNKQLAAPWYYYLKSLSKRDLWLMAQRLAQAIKRFDVAPIAHADLEEEFHDLKYIRHHSTNQVPSDILAFLESYWPEWQKIVEESPVSLAPRDFYRNLLVGAPLFVSAKQHPLTLIDFGESYKLSSSAERLAQCILTIVYISDLDSVGKLSWIEHLSQASQSLGIGLAGVAFYLTLWAVRWHLWDAGEQSDLTPFLKLFQSNEPLETSEEIMSFCKTIL